MIKKGSLFLFFLAIFVLIASFALYSPLSVNVVSFFAILDGTSSFSGSAMTTDNVRIVDFGSDYMWNYQNVYYRGETFEVLNDYDVDGDGQTSDDSVAYREFSMTRPLNALFPNYNTDKPSAKFYGGTTVYFSNYATPTTDDVQEGCVNADHGWRDDYNLHAYSFPGRGDGLKAHGVWIWDKSDFLHNGNESTVTFNSDSEIKVYVSRYWRCFEEVRFVIRDGAQFYISETTFSGNNDNLGKAHILSPMSTRWAEYNPEHPYKIDFDFSLAEFSPHTFSDVTAGGFYVGVNSLGIYDCQMKWNAFEFEAVVGDGLPESEVVPLSSIPGGTATLHDGSTVTIEPFYMTSTEIPYSVWKKIYQWADSNQYVLTQGYLFDKDGDMGSMDFKSFSHYQDEPVTDISFYDAVIWANALSEYEGRTPVYYSNIELSKPLRKSEEKYILSNYNVLPEIYVKWDADGYRLPTEAEWEYASQSGAGLRYGYGGAIDGDYSWFLDNADETTHEVGVKLPNSYGLYDIFGNVFELVWHFSGDYSLSNPSFGSNILALGGDINYPESPLSHSASPSGDKPYDGNYNIGLRLVRRDEGYSEPPIGAIPFEYGYDDSGPVSWYISTETRSEDYPSPQVTIPQVSISGGTFKRFIGNVLTADDYNIVSISPFDMASTEIPYYLWKEVYQWAENSGYEFDHDGDMGSMDFKSFSHSPDEPVTDISWVDATLWANALSEYEGRTPVYYSDAEKTEVYRVANRFRFPMINLSDEKAIRTSISYYSEIYPKWSADGYRLPTEAEWEYALRAQGVAGSETTYPWGNSEGNIGLYSWYASNSNNKSQSVGTKLPNAYGLYDMSGNVFELTWDKAATNYDYYDSINPKGSDIFFGVTPGYTHNVRGASFKYGDLSNFNANKRFEVQRFVSDAEIGFRVVRNEEGVLPDSSEKIETFFIEPDSPAPDNLQGATHRANIQRTGEYTTSGVPYSPSVLWSANLPAETSASPIVVNNILYIGDSSGKMHAFNALDGNKIWEYDTGAEIESTVTVAENKVIFGNNDGNLFALDSEDGSLVWRFNNPMYWDKSAEGSPAVAYGYVFAPLGYPGVYALDLETGERKWKNLGYPGSHNSVAISGNFLVYSTAGSGPFVNIVDLLSGQNYGLFDGGYVYTITPSLIGNNAYFATESFSENNVFAVDVNANTGKYGRRNAIWSYLPEADPTRHITTAQAVGDDKAYFGNLAGELIALNIEDGSKMWEYKTEGTINSDPSLAQGILYFGSDDGNIYSLNAETGNLNWKYFAGSEVVGSPYIGNNFIYTSLKDGTILALHSLPPVSYPPVGMNMDKITYFSSMIMYSNVMKQANLWLTQTVPKNDTWDTGVQDLMEFDEDGYPIEVPYTIPNDVNKHGVSTILFTGINGKYPSGQYTLLYDGEGSFEFSGDIKTFYRDGAGKYILNVVPSNTGMIVMLVESKRENHVRNVSIILPGLGETYSDNKFNPVFLSALENFSVLRFMEAGSTNYYSATEPLSWENRLHTTYYTYNGNRGMPWEDMIEISNILDTDLWITIPHSADDNYVFSLARLIKRNLEPERKIYLEYSNELWNGIFPQTIWIQTRGCEMESPNPCYDGIGNDYADRFLAGINYQIYRSSEISKIFEDVFSGGSRIVEVLGTQAANLGVTYAVLSVANNSRYNINNISFDAISPAAYFGGQVGDEIVTEGLADTINPEEILLLANESIDDLMNILSIVKSESAKYNMEMIAYEGGHHLVLNYANREEYPQLVQNLIETNRNPEMKEIFERNMRRWKEIGGGLFVSFSFVGPYNKYGSFGALEWQDQSLDESYKYLALQEAISSRKNYLVMDDSDLDGISNSRDCNDLDSNIKNCKHCQVCSVNPLGENSSGVCVSLANSSVNDAEGCPIPSFSSFNDERTTNLRNVNLSSVSNISLGVSGKGMIKLKEKMSFLNFSNGRYYPLDIDNLIRIEARKITVDTENYPEFNGSANLIFYGINSNDYQIYKNGQLFTDYELIQSPNSENEYTLEIEVSSLSTYEVYSPSSSDSPPSGGSGGSGGGGGGGSAGISIAKAVNDSLPPHVKSAQEEEIYQGLISNYSDDEPAKEIGKNPELVNLLFISGIIIVVMFLIFIILVNRYNKKKSVNKKKQIINK